MNEKKIPNFSWIFLATKHKTQSSDLKELKNE